MRWLRSSRGKIASRFLSVANATTKRKLPGTNTNEVSNERLHTRTWLTSPQPPERGRGAVKRRRVSGAKVRGTSQACDDAADAGAHAAAAAATRASKQRGPF